MRLPTIRPARPTDYPAIAEVNAAAFGAYLDTPEETTHVAEVAMVDAMRHATGYDRELSLVAATKGRVVGHAFFMPFTTMVDSQPVRAVSLGPISVHPDYQNRGIGGALIRAGHKTAALKGFAYCFLLGHENYYPRFGYQPGMFGDCRLLVPMQNIPTFGNGVEARPVRQEDVTVLKAMWQDWFHDVDLALVPGNSLVEWIPHTPEITASCMFKNNRLIGYLRFTRSEPYSPKLFLARDAEAALAILAYLKNKCTNCPSNEIALPAHPESIAVAEYLSALHWTMRINRWNAAMIHMLDPHNESVAAYCREVADGTRLPGLVVYPPFMEFT